jgi:hypothetical protein
LRQADVDRLAFLADEKSFVAGNRQTFWCGIRVWDLASGKELRRLQGTVSAYQTH